MNSWESEFGNAFAGRTVLVTGATGFIGWHLCGALAELGAEVYGLSRYASTKNLPEGCRARSIDIRNYEAVQKVITRELQPEIIFHLAGIVTARQDISLVLPTLQYNLTGTVHLLLAASHAGCRCFVCVGSSEEALDDNRIGVPFSPYSAAKTSASLYARMFYELYGLPVVLIRPHMVYGPRQVKDKVIPHTILSLLRGEAPRLSSGKRICDFIYVVDVVRGLLKAGSMCQRAKGETIELATGSRGRLRDVVELIAELTGSGLKPEFGALPDRIEESYRTADCDKASRVLGWKPLWSLREGLAETIRWYRENLCNRGKNGEKS